ncbi:transketolase [Metamycoplasma hominis]|uniref:transketolase n=1 Tax=Metamycoplasma hominis TaxID=2098 RepID=UPI0034A43590
MKNKKIDQIAIDNIKINSLNMAFSWKYSDFSSIMSGAKIFHALFGYFFNINRKNNSDVNRDRFVFFNPNILPLFYEILRLYSLISENEYLNLISNRNQNISYSNWTLDWIKSSEIFLGISGGFALGNTIAQNYLNRLDKNINHFTYWYVTERELQEGSTQEALAYAGTHNLRQLIVIYDANEIEYTVDSKSINPENIAKKVESMNFKYIEVSNGQCRSIIKAIKKAQKINQPVFIKILSPQSEQLFKKNFDNSITHEKLEEFKDKTSFQKTNLSDLYSEVVEFYENRLQKIENKIKTFSNSNNLQIFLKNNIRENINDVEEFKEKTYIENALKIINNLCDKYKNLLVLSNDISYFQNIKSLNGIFASNNLGRGIFLGNREFTMINMAMGLGLHSSIETIVIADINYLGYLLPTLQVLKYSNAKILILLINNRNNFSLSNELKILYSYDHINLLRPCDFNELKGAFEFHFNHTKKSSIIYLENKEIKEIKDTSKVEFEDGPYYIRKISQTTNIIAAGSDLRIAEIIARRLNSSIISISNIENIESLNYDRNNSILIESYEALSHEKIAKYNIALNKFCNLEKNDEEYIVEKVLTSIVKK